MANISVQEAQATLSELIHRLSPGDEIFITENNEPVARLTAAVPRRKENRRLGTLAGTVLHIAPDFDVPLDDFSEYMK